jgi:hypothetical protein
MSDVPARGNGEQLTALTPGEGSLKEVRCDIRGGHAMGESANARKLAEGAMRRR